MQTKIYIFLLQFIALLSMGQTKGINYQAVIIDPKPIEIPGIPITGQPLQSTKIVMRFILKTKLVVDYEEIHQTQTDSFGLINLTIGEGKSISTSNSRYKSFDLIDWDSNLKNLIAFVSFDNGNSFIEVSNQKLSFTPYALYAESVEYKNVRDSPKNISFFLNDVGYLIPKDLDPLKKEVYEIDLVTKSNTKSITTNQIENSNKFILVNQTLSEVSIKIENNTKSILINSASIVSLANSIQDLNNRVNEKESLANKSNSIIDDAGSEVKYPTVKAIKNYVDQAVANNGVQKIQLNGTVFKGSFLSGSLLFFYELDNTLNQTGFSFNTTIEDDFGNFTLKAQNLAGKMVRVVGDGFYWNEVLNENSTSRITLTSISKIQSSETINVNVLTHLERPRVEYLYSTAGLTFENAKSQALTEVLQVFGIKNPGITRSEKVNIIGNNEESKILLAISTLIQGYRSESEVTQILTDISEDIKKDGILTNVSLGNDLATHLYYIDTVSVLNYVKTKYRKIYDPIIVNTLNLSYLSRFKDSTNFTKDRELFEFPLVSNSYGVKNILNESFTSFTGREFATTANITRKGMKLKVEVINEDGTSLDGADFGFPLGLNIGWIISKPAYFIPTYTSNIIGLHDTFTNYSNFKRYKVNFYEKGFSTPSRFKYVNLNP